MKVSKVEDADIIVDRREPQRIKENLSSRGFTISVESLGIGDYVWGETAIERKTLNDFLSSLLPRKRKGPRIWRQAKGLSEEFEHPFIIISGTSISLQKKDLYKEKQIYGTIAALLEGFSIPVIRTETEREFVLLIESLYNRGEKKSLSRPYPSTPASSPHHQKVENVLCIDKNTPLLTRGRVKKIKNIEIGDKIASGGDWATVTNKWETRKSGLQLKPRGMPRFIVSKDHPIKTKLRTYSWSTDTNQYEPELGQEEFKKAKNLNEINGSIKILDRKADMLIFPRYKYIKKISELRLPQPKRKSGPNRNFKEKLPLNEDTAWLFGIYVAEGHTSNAETTFSLNINETDIRKKIRRIIWKYLERRERTEKDNNCIQCSYGGVQLQRLLESKCGKGAENKKVPACILDNEKNIIKSFLAGYWAGDGYEIKRGNRRKKKGANSVSLNLVFGLAKLISKLDAVPYIKKTYSGKKGTIQGRKVNQQDLWEVSYYPQELEGEYIRKIMRDDNNFYFPLIEKKEVGKREMVNLETTNHLFDILNMVTHNCQVPRVGIKTSQKILKKYGSLVNLIHKLEEEPDEIEDFLSSKKKKNLEKVLLNKVKYYKGS